MRVPLLTTLGVALAAASATVMASCGGDDVQSDAVKFCQEATAHQGAIIDPPVSDEVGLEATLEFYRLMGELAPVSIATEWNQLVAALETAAAYDPTDPASEQHVVATAYAAEGAAYDVKVWLQRNCGLDIPISTIAPHEQVSAITTTTATPETTVASDG